MVSLALGSSNNIVMQRILKTHHAVLCVTSEGMHVSVVWTFLDIVLISFFYYSRGERRVQTYDYDFWTPTRLCHI